MNKKRILFVSCYSEALKTFIPIIKSLKTNYEIHIVANSRNVKKEISRNEELCKSIKVNSKILLSKNPVDKYPSSKIPLIYRLLSPLFLIKTKVEASKFIKDIKPNILIVAADKRELERFLIAKCNDNNIPTICFQWALGPVTKNSFFENKNEILINDKNINNKKTSLISFLIRIPKGMISILLGLRTPIHADCYGGGDSKILSAMGDGSKKYFISMGVSKNKIDVIGHPLIENLFYRKVNRVEKNNILYATCYKKADYYKIVSKKEVLQYRKKIATCITNTSKNNRLIMKLHPNEELSDFEPLEKKIKNLSVIDEGEINNMISSCKIFISRASTSILYALIYNKPVISFNFPQLPMGNVYKEIGGTLHANNIEELTKYIKLIEEKDRPTLELIRHRKEVFLKKYLNIDVKHIQKKNDVLPSIKRFNDLISRELRKI